MESEHLTKAEALEELIQFLDVRDEPEGEGWVQVGELLEHIQQSSSKLSENRLRKRMQRGVEEGRLERVRVGKNYYYRVVKPTERKET